MWQIIGLQILVAGASVVALFLKRESDFDPTVSVILALVALICAALSVIAFASQDNDTRFIKRNIENLVRSITLNSFARDLITTEISKQSGFLGFHSMKATTFQDGLSAFTLYRDKEDQPPEGVVLIGKADFNRFAVLDEKELPSRIRTYLEEPLGKHPTEDWNLLVQELGQAARYVAQELGTDPSIATRVWANANDRRIGIATNPDLKEPDVTVDSKGVEELITLSRIQRHQRLVQLIESFLLDKH
jgi:hypothetical protein